jgi:tetratricopeptide (TPR) repeat protein
MLAFSKVRGCHIIKDLIMSDNNAQDFIQDFENAALAIKDETERSKKYRAGVAALARRAVSFSDMTYLEAAERFTDHIIDENNRSRAFVDIVRSTARVAVNTANMNLVNKSLELSTCAHEGLDRSHAIEEVISAMAEVGAAMDNPAVIEDAKKFTEIIEFDTYCSTAWRNIAMTLHSIDDTTGAMQAAHKALDIIDASYSISHMIYKASAYVKLSTLFLDLGHADIARECTAKALECASSITNKFDLSSIYQSIAENQIRMGARLTDRSLFIEAVESFNKITQEYYRTSTKQTLTNILSNFNEKELIKRIEH